jgi:hypothetical protein
MTILWTLYNAKIPILSSTDEPLKGYCKEFSIHNLVRFLDKKY